MAPNQQIDHDWWNDLRHNGVLISAQVLGEYFTELMIPDPWRYRALRDSYNTFDTWLKTGNISGGQKDALYKWCDIVFENLLGYKSERFLKGNNIPASYSHTAMTGDNLKPNRILFDSATRETPLCAISIEPPVKGRQGYRMLGVGKGRTSYSKLLEYLRLSNIKLGILTNGIQIRLVYASADHETWVEWDVRSWFEDEQLRQQLHGFLTLLSEYGTQSRDGATFPLLQAIETSRSKQAELASVMGTQIRSAVELIIDHLNIAKQKQPDILKNVFNNGNNGMASSKQVRDALYQAASRIIMRVVVVLFAEAKDLLSRSQLIYEQSYGVEGLFEQLRKARQFDGPESLEDRYYAWNRLLALFKLIHDGCSYADLNIQQYGGILFRPGDSSSDDIVLRAMSVFEENRFRIPDSIILRILERLKIGRIKVKQGRSSRMVQGMVDFSDLRTEFIGIMYEGLLDFELHATPQPMVVLNLGKEPVLPLDLLEAKSDKELKDLISKLGKEDKDKSESGEDSEDEESDDESLPDEAEEETEEIDDTVDDQTDQEYSEVDRRKMQAVDWAKRAAEAAGMIKQKRGEDDYYYQKRLDKAADRLIVKVIDKDEFYLARWGGTRKGTGTFYTKPGLAVPTARRTLEPLLFDTVDGKQIPKTPEDILALKVCDPSCGSASFLVAALHYITEALYKSLIYHRKINVESPVTPVLPFGTSSEGKLKEDLLPVSPSDERFEDMVRSRLRRHVVERCIYGVDLNPMAVELARLSLWIETMDSRLPFGFLDHKIKVGNSLVGCWFDTFGDYPLAAWLREGGNKDDTEKITDQLKGERAGKGGKGRRPGQGIVLEQMKRIILRKAGVMPLGFHEQGVTPDSVHDDALKKLQEIHDITIGNPEKRERKYKEEFLGNEIYHRLKQSFDAWCAAWFWPVDKFDEALPSPDEIFDPGERTIAMVNELADRYKFFHWELEFPDVFITADSGFDVIVGNPPWEISKPNSKEFFSNYDPVYRTYGKQEAVKKQESMMEQNPNIEREWRNYTAFFKAMSNWNKHAAFPFGYYDYEDKSSRITFSRSRGENTALHDDWKRNRARQKHYADRRHPYRYQGAADINLYKMFLESSYALLKHEGRLGMIVPSGIYTDNGTRELRELFIENSKWEWLFSFENRKKLFDIDSRFKFCPVIIKKGFTTDAINTAFMRHDLKDWEENAINLATPYDKSQITIFSPKSKALLELRSKRDIEIIEKIYANSVLLGDDSEDGWQIKYSREFDMTNDSKLFHPRPWWEQRGYRPDAYGRWVNPDGEIALPLYEGRMIGQFDFSEKGWVSGKGRSAVWRDIGWDDKVIEPQYLMDRSLYLERVNRNINIKLGLMDISSATNRRTMILSTLSNSPCGHTLGVLNSTNMINTIILGALLNSFMFDYLLRGRMGGLHVSYYILEESALIRKDTLSNKVIYALTLSTLSLNNVGGYFSYLWLQFINKGFQIKNNYWQSLWAITPHERLRLRVILDAIVAELYGLDYTDLEWILRNDPSDPKGFWRVDKDKPEHLRQTTLTLLAFKHLKEVGLERFISEDWQFPEHIARQLGPRYLDWQKPNATEEEIKQSWQECEMHAKNILGEEEFEKFKRRLERGEDDMEEQSRENYDDKPGQGQLGL